PKNLRTVGASSDTSRGMNDYRIIEANADRVLVDGEPVPPAELVATLSELVKSGIPLWSPTHRETVTALRNRGVAIRGIKDLTAAEECTGYPKRPAQTEHRGWGWVESECRWRDLWLHREARGWLVDTDGLRALVDTLTARIDTLNTSWDTDLTSATASELGLESVRLPDLRKLEPQTPLVTALIEAGEAKADITKARELLRHASGGRVHPTINAAGAATWRMTVSAPALHNMRGGLRRYLMAEPDEVLIGADWSACEVKVAAWLSGDPRMRADLATGDIYATIAANLGIDRAVAKRVLLAPLYGQGDAGLGQSLGMTEAEAAEVREHIFGPYRKLRQWMRTVARTHDEAVYCSGVGQRQLPIPEPHRKVNYVVQSTARDLLVQAVLRVVDDPKLGVDTVWMAVHDELTLSVPRDRVEPCLEHLRAAMEFDLDGVQLTAEPMVLGERWGHP
uniref:DNA polymerase n=1 Tax=uncultured Tessaracoccus sp. TaxID=905023 RepID=UPI002615F515